MCKCYIEVIRYIELCLSECYIEVIRYIKIVYVNVTSNLDI
jgi:hypothetical protein